MAWSLCYGTNMGEDVARKMANKWPAGLNAYNRLDIKYGKPFGGRFSALRRFSEECNRKSPNNDKSDNDRGRK